MAPNPFALAHPCLPLQFRGEGNGVFNRGSSNGQIRLPNDDVPGFPQQRCHGGILGGVQAMQSKRARGSSHAKGGGTDQVLCRRVSRPGSQSRHQVTSDLEDDGDSMKLRSRTQLSPLLFQGPGFSESHVPGGGRNHGVELHAVVIVSRDLLEVQIDELDVRAVARVQKTPKLSGCGR